MSKLPPLPHWCESGSPFAEQMQAYALAAIQAQAQQPLDKVVFCTYPKCQTTGMRCAGTCSQANSYRQGVSDESALRAIEAAATEPLLQRIAELEHQLKEWLDKTEWVQESAKAGEFGMHRADVLALRIAKLELENKQLKKEVDRLLAAHESTVNLYSLASRKG